jgi:hypothetical protein
MDNELLFRCGIVSFIIVVILDVLVAWALYIFFKPVNNNLALLAAWFRLVFLAIWGSVLHAQVMLFIESFRIGWVIGLVFFGLHLLVIGYLMFKSGFMPKIVGVLLIISAFGYLIDSFAHFLLSNYTDYELIFLLIVAVPGIIAELSLCFWLLIKGVKVQQTQAAQNNYQSIK